MTGTFDLAAHLRPGDTITWGALSAEPLALTRALARDAAKVGDLTLFLTMGATETVMPSPALRAIQVGGGGANRRFLRDGNARVIPTHYSDIERFIAAGRIKIDVVLIQTTPPDAAGRCNAGVGLDILGSAIGRARVVIAQTNDAMPWTAGDTTLPADAIHVRVPGNEPLVEVTSKPPSAIERAVAENVARLVPDRATLQFGLGAIPDAMPVALGAKRGIGIHSGIIGDGVLDLIEAGVVDNRHKEIDDGLTVTMLLAGTKRLYQWAHRNPSLAVRPSSYTHAAPVLNRFDRFVGVNSAIEVDLTGQVNAETVDGRYVGFVGGQVDFTRAAIRAPHGRSILALPSTTRDRTRSRIVATLADAVVTTARSDADTVVTEHGIAELAGRTLEERARAMIAIADPEFRPTLTAALDKLC